jgi:hypothetical protein
MIRINVLLVLLLMSSAAQSIQKIKANPDEAVQIVASLTDANVITLTGGSIESVWGTEDKVTLEANLDTGQAIFRPTTREPFTLFVQSDSGNTYTLSVVPRTDIIGQVILLNEFHDRETSGLNRTSAIVSYKSDVKRLLKQIDQSPGVKKLQGFTINMINKEIPLWAETKIVHALSWSQGSMIIDKVLVTNISDKPLVLDEREFSHIQQYIRAISLRKHQLEPAETTILYTFRNPS